MTEPRVALVQDGSRGHYGLALALHRAHALEAMYTDFFIKSGSVWDWATPLLRRVAPAGIRRMLERRSPGLDTATVHTQLLGRLRQDRQKRAYPDITTYYRWQAADNAAWIGPMVHPPANILMGFIRNLDPGLCRLAKRRGMLTVGDQMIAPAVVEKREFALQQERFPEWEAHSSSELDGFIDIENDTWPELDAITCPSQYVADGLVEAGISAERVHVVNYPIDEKAFTFTDRSGSKGPVRVGFVGQINLRKGIPYFVEVAKRFPRDRVTFTLIGHSNLTPTANAEMRKYVEDRSVTRSQVPAELAAFDLIYMPTTCEGSAYALMEAMATGLPIVTSPNSGTVARHGVEGFLCAYDDLDAATAHIERLVSDVPLRLAMGRAAHERYQQFGLAHYSEAVMAVCRRVLAEHASV